MGPFLCKVPEDFRIGNRLDNVAKSIPEVSEVRIVEVHGAEEVGEEGCGQPERGRENARNCIFSCS
jgi:hypothetical protein